MATLDDVVDALNRLNDTMEEVRDEIQSGGAGGGGAKGSGSRGRGQAGGASGGADLEGGSAGIGAAFKKTLGSAKAISRLLDQTGVSASLREASLGASASEASAAGVRSAVRQAGSLPTGQFQLSRAQNVLEFQGRSQQTVSGLAEQVARAGGEIDEDSIRSSLGRFNEIERNVQNARNRVRQIQGEVGGDELRQALRQDAAEGANRGVDVVAGAVGSEELGKAIKELTEVMRQQISNSGGGFR